MKQIAFALLALLPPLASAQAEIHVIRTAASVGANPDHPAWETVPASIVKLETAFPGHPSISGTAITQEAEVRALATPKGLAIRLEWNDPATDDRMTQHLFVDGAAVQFAHDGKADTIPYMGGAGRHVNIWYWSAAKNSGENLRADGFGTLARLPTQDVKAYGHHVDGRWRVAFYRAWRSKDPNATSLRGALPVAFAIWNGANNERDGFKAVTMQWQTLRER